MLILIFEALLLALLSVGYHLILWRARPEWMLHRYPPDVFITKPKRAFPIPVALLSAALYLLYPTATLVLFFRTSAHFSALPAILRPFFQLFTANGAELALSLWLLGKRSPNWVRLQGDAAPERYHNPLYQVIRFQKGILACLLASGACAALAYLFLLLHELG